MYLDELPSAFESVGKGSVGRRGQLGVGGKPVRVGGTFYQHALGAHAPSRVEFELNGAYAYFECRAGLNDDAVWDDPAAEFTVVADGRVIAQAAHVRVGREPKEISADVRGVKSLVLITKATGSNFLHTVWLEPHLHEARRAPFVSPLGSILVYPPDVPVKTTRCVATVTSKGFAPYLEGFLSTLYFYGCIPDAPVLVFNINSDPASSSVIKKYNAQEIRCETDGPLTAVLKTVVYSVARVATAEEFLCIDSDTLIVGDLRPIFYSIRACPQDRIFLCREMNIGSQTLEDAFVHLYHGLPREWGRIGATRSNASYPLIVNTGLIAGSRKAMRALDAEIRRLPPYARKWESEKPACHWREQFLANLALAKMDCAVELDTSYNVQLLNEDVGVQHNGKNKEAWFGGRRSKVLHFNGSSRGKYPDLLKAFAVRFE